ncbi:MAG: transglycosylase SLT domain-containing protein [Succinivibrionaceae bacterium]
MIYRIILLLLIFYSCNADAVSIEGKPIKHFGDLSNIIERQTFRVLVSYDNISFFMNKGKQDGLYIALMREFKQYLRKKNSKAKNLKIYFIPTHESEMPRLIAQGYGDIAMSILPTEELEKYVDMSIPEKLWIKEIIVSNKGGRAIKKIEDLSGLQITVRKKSSYYQSLKNINSLLLAKNLPLINILIANEYLTDVDLVRMVSNGDIRNTVINNSKLIVWKRLFKDVNFSDNLPIKVNGSFVWIMRHGSPELFKIINKFLRKYRDGTPMGSPIYARYMRTSPSYEMRYQRKENEWLGINEDSFTKYTELFKTYGDKFKIDWMLLLAQSYQESTLNPKATSSRGAVGLMQILPSTAKEKYINVDKVEHLDNNVHAGTKYLRYMLDNYFGQNDLAQGEKILFALASYNAGPNRITRYRKEAYEKGLDPNKWFDNVEKIAEQHGAYETVNYVKNISSLYISYQKAYKMNQEKKNIPKFKR